MIARVAAGLAIAGVVLAGCADKVSGHAESGGAPPPTSTSTTPGAGESTAAQGSGTAPPSSSSNGSPSAPTGHLACPGIVDLAAHLAYTCVNNAMTRSASPLWAFKVERPVDVHWTMDEGSGDLTAITRSEPAAAAAKTMTTRMIAKLYGTPLPVTRTVQDVDVTVGSARGHLIQTLITINPGYAKAQHLRVKQERLWIVAVPVARGKMSGWYTSIPDLARGSWPAVPDVIKGLHIV